MSISSSRKIRLKRHVKRRAYERYGVVLANDRLKRIVRTIQNAEAKFLARRSNRVTVWEVEVEGQNCRVLYDKNKKQIITFIPLLRRSARAFARRRRRLRLLKQIKAQGI